MESGVKQKDLIQDISQIVLNDVKPKVKIGELESLVKSSGLFVDLFEKTDEIRPNFVAYRMNKLFESNPNLFESIDNANNKQELSNTLFDAVQVLAGTSYESMDTLVNTQYYNKDTGTFYSRMQQGAKSLRDDPNYSMDNLPVDLSKFIDFLRDASEIYHG